MPTPGNSRKSQGEVGKTLEEFLTHALLSAVPITSPDVPPSFLASCGVALITNRTR
jgi:hypothetical protein